MTIRDTTKTTASNAPAKAAPAKVAPKTRPLSRRAAAKAEEEANIRRLVEVKSEATQRITAEAVELTKLPPAELVRHWEANERKIKLSRHKGDIYNVSWLILVGRSMKLEDLIAREQLDIGGLVTKLRFLENHIDQDDEYGRELAASCRADAEKNITF
jgi:hypothetical protein